MPASIASCRLLLLARLLSRALVLVARVSSLLFHKVVKKGGEGILFGNRLSCWFLPGLKDQVNVKTKATQRKAMIPGCCSSLCILSGPSESRRLAP